jgi:hypothetical protein
MRTRFCITSVVGLLGVALPLAVAAEEGGWKMPHLNPFSSKAKPATAPRTAAPPTSGWKMPKLLPSPAAATPKRKPNQPSTWSKMSSGTKSSFSKTADALTPWDNKPATPQPSVTGSNSYFTQKGAGKPESKTGGVSPASWWNTPKDEQPKSVNEFLSRPRPQ